MASHKTRQLDPRPVAEVSADGRQVWLEFPAGYVYGPFPSKNYDFRAVTR